MTRRRWLFGDQLGPHFLDDDSQQVLLVELLDPVEVAQPAEDAYRRGSAPLASVEGFIRQVVGWRDYVWHLYWHLGPDYRGRNELGAHGAIPAWFQDLDPTGTRAACVSSALTSVRGTGWTHHIPRLMVLGNHAQQRAPERYPLPHLRLRNLRSRKLP